VNEGLFAGLDVSTQSCKLVVLDATAGRVVHVDAVEYDSDLPQYETEGGTVRAPEEGVSESDPRMWIDAVRTVLGRLAESSVNALRIRCISVSGQQHGLVALDERGELARPLSKLWNDYSTLEECELLTQRIGGPERMIEEVGNVQRPGYTAGKILHMVRREPEAYRRASTLFLVHDFINWYLTGGVAAMEPGDASGMAVWNPATGRFSDAVLDAIDPDLSSKLPDVGRSDRTIGSIAPELASSFGLSPSCRVDAGSGDNMYGAIGTGNVAPGMVTISLGTSGTIYTVLEEPWLDPSGEIAAFRDSTGRHLPLLCVSNMANGYAAVRQRFGLSHQDFDALIDTSEPGNGGRLVLPWYEGERTPDLPLAAPLYFGFQIDDFGPEVLARAVLEGHVLNLHAGFARMPVDSSEVRLTGGLARSPSWRQVIADVFAVDVVSVEGEGAALGAAIHAAWVWGREAGADVSLAELVERCVPVDGTRRTAPRASSAEAYRKLRALFQALRERILGQGGADPFSLRAALLEATGADG
jgi:xylulokinase